MDIKRAMYIVLAASLFGSGASALAVASQAASPIHVASVGHPVDRSHDGDKGDKSGDKGDKSKGDRSDKGDRGDKGDKGDHGQPPLA